MNGPRTKPAIPWLVLFTSLVISFGFWRWAESVLVPANTQVVEASHQPIGNNSDLYPQWLAARELLLHHRNPYSQAVTSEIQSGFYGRPLRPSDPSEPRDREAFVYPLYVIFLLAPTVNLPFAISAEIFRGLLLLCIAASVPLWLSAMRLQFPPVLTIALMFLSVSTLAAFYEYHQDNLTPLVALMLAGAIFAAARNWFSLGGLLLALSSIKPQLSGWFVAFVLLWAASNWKHAKRLVIAFTFALAAFWFASDALLPHWERGFLGAMRDYSRYGTDFSILQVLLPGWLAKLAALSLVIALAYVCWRRRHAEIGTDEFNSGLAWTVSVTLAILPKLAAYNQVLLFPALLFFMLRWRSISRAGRLARALVKGAFACLLWPWSAALVLAVLSFLIPPQRLEQFAHVPEYTSLALVPVTLMAVIATTIAARAAASRALSAD